MSCSHVRLMMVLKGDKSSTTENCTFWITGPTWTSSTTCPREVVEASLNPDSIHPGFSRADDGNTICFYADICNKSTELPGSTKIRLTLKSLIPRVRTKTSSWDYNTQLESIGGKVITPSIGHVSPLGKLGWMEVTCSLTEANQSNLCLFRLELYFSSTGLPWM